MNAIQFFDGRRTVVRKNINNGGFANTHNFIKACTIDIVKPCKNPRILDLGCGQGGDIKKIMKLNPSIVFATDVSHNALGQYIKRIKNTPCNIYIFSHDMRSSFHDDSRFFTKFDMINCQFSLHHSFENETTAQNCIKSVSELLVVGGMFVISIPIHERSFEKTTVIMDNKSYIESTVSKEVLVEICNKFNLELDTWLSYEDAYLYYKEIYSNLYNSMKVESYPKPQNICAVFVRV